MKSLLVLAGVAAIALSTTSADAGERWFKRKWIPQWPERNFTWFEDDGDVAYYEDDADEAEAYYQRRRGRVIEREIDESEIWWMEERARDRLEQRKARKRAAKKANIKKAQAPVVEKKAVTKKVKPKVVAAKSDKPVSPKLETASLTPAKPAAKPKPAAKTLAKNEPKSDAKTIGCTAGAAVITGYGFGDVKPKACTGDAYAYSATRAGKAYEIKLTASSGEITDVKKLN
jgi:hypothetical protein